MTHRSRQNDEELHASPTGEKYGLMHLRKEMLDGFSAIHRRIDDHNAFVYGDKGDGTDSAKVRLARVEWIASVAIAVAGMVGAATAVISVKVFFFGAAAVAGSH